MEISRDFYLQKLIQKKNNGLIKVITGFRRCGKSYLLNNIFYNYLFSDQHLWFSSWPSNYREILKYK